MRGKGGRMGRGVIALVSDFGSRDVFVGVMKAVMAGIAPGVGFIDLTHEVPPGDVRAGAFALWQSVPFLPAGAVVLAVVDPGVGTSRRAVAVRFPDFTFVGPDNGLVTFLLARRKERIAVEIASPAYQRDRVSSTFHGRDIFAPAAAHLAAGADIMELGPKVESLTLLPYPKLAVHPGIEAGPVSEIAPAAGEPARFRAGEGPIVSGEVLHVDAFGNLVTSIGVLRRDAGALLLEPWLPSADSIMLSGELDVLLPGGARIPLVAAFAQAPLGVPLAYIGSDGLLEVAVNRGSAAELFSLSPGAEISLSCRGRSRF
jgi:S-adenosylmethionine hydrolase